MNQSGLRGTQTPWPVVGTAAVLIGFAVAHVLEDFVYGIPAQFGLEVAPAAALLGLGFAVHVVLIALAARDQPLGLAGNAVVGMLWFLAAAFDHLDEVLFANPYRAGIVSKLFEVGLMLSGLALAAVAFRAWRTRVSARSSVSLNEAER